MTVLGRLFRASVENPARPLTDTTLLSLLGGYTSATGRNVSPEGALRVGAAFRGTQIISTAIAGLPFKVYRHSDRGEVLGSILSPAGPAGVTTYAATPYERWSQVIGHMVLWGNAYIWKVRNRAGIVTALVPVHPSRVKVDVDDGPDAADVGVPFVKRFTIDGKLLATNYEVMHVWGLSLDGVKGLGPISYVREAFGIALTAEEAAARLYGQGMMLSGILTTEQRLDQKQAANIKNRWRAKLSGVDAAGDIAVLDSGAKFQPLSMPPEDAQFLESRKFQVTEIARLLGMPGWMLNDQEKSTSWGTGMEQQFTTWIMLTLRAYTTPIEQRVTADLLPSTQYAEFGFEGLLRGDAAARSAFYASGIQHGWLVPNDVRPRENLPPVEWGDVPYAAFNQTAAPAQEPGDTDSGESADSDGGSDEDDE